MNYALVNDIRMNNTRVYLKRAAKSRAMRFAIQAVTVSSVLLVASSCATTIDSSVPTTNAESTQTSATTPVTIDPSLSQDQLLTQLLATINDLSLAMQKADRKLATKYLEQVVAISDAVRPELAKISEQLAVDFDRVVSLTKSSVERNRPADADKALRFLPLIIESLKNF